MRINVRGENAPSNIEALRFNAPKWVYGLGAIRFCVQGVILGLTRYCITHVVAI